MTDDGTAPETAAAGPTEEVTGNEGAGEEVERKFRILDMAAAERWLTSAAIGDLRPTRKKTRTVQMEDRYVDTPDGALAAAGLAARMRRTGDTTIVSLKSLASTAGPGGAVRRLELEGPADPAAPVGQWPPSEARARILEHAGDVPLEERVIVRQVRRKRILQADGSRAELSVDAVEVLRDGAVLGGWDELELELRSGDAAVLGPAGDALAADPGLAPSPRSKLEAALDVLASGGESLDARRAPAAPAPDRGTPPQATPDPAEPPPPRLRVGKSPGVAGDDHIAEAGRKVLRFHLARMLDLEVAARSGDVNAVHKMRVATRRQRAAWRIFGDAYRPNRTKRYRTGLRETAGRLGAVRDLDVLLEAADVYRADLPVTEQRALEPLLHAWRTERDRARVLLERELAGAGFGRWVDDYVDFVETEGAAVLPVGPVQPHRVRDTAPSRIWAAYEQVRGYESVLRWADVETLHDLRIAGKWLRYSLEFVREALGSESGPLIARVTALQDHLGLMHDADVTAAMARTFLVDHAGDLSPLESAAIGRYLVDRERETARLRRTIGPTWRGVASLRFRRQLGRVVAGL